MAVPWSVWDLVQGRIPMCQPANSSGTPFSTALNLAATSMGTGLLTLPHVFACGGPKMASALLLVLAVTTEWVVKFLGRVNSEADEQEVGAGKR